MRNTLIFFLLLTFLASPISSADAGNTAPETIIGAETISAEKAKQLLDQGAVFIDLRAEDDFAKGHIPTAKNLNIAGAFNKASLEMFATKDKPVVFYCYGISCMRSYSASKRAVNWGYTQIKYFRTGMPAWRKA